MSEAASVAQRLTTGGAFLCPSCGEGTRVTDSRPTSHGIRRRRICTACRRRVSTLEVVIDGAVPLPMWQLVAAISDRLVKAQLELGSIQDAVGAAVKLREVLGRREP